MNVTAQSRQDFAVAYTNCSGIKPGPAGPEALALHTYYPSRQYQMPEAAVIKWRVK